MRNQFLLRILLNTFAVIIASYILSGIHVSSFGYAIWVAVVLAVLNASLKPILVILTLPATLFSFGLFLLFINAFVVKTAAWLIGDGFRVDSWSWAILFGILLWAVNNLLERLIVQPVKVNASQYENTNSSTKIFDKDGNRIA